jgi:hypothetical protein
MATKTVSIDAINATWAGASGAATDIDEAIASADGNLYGPGPEADAADFGFASPSLADADTITGISVTVRLLGSGTAGAEQADVEFLIGGVVKGATKTTGDLTGSFANYGPFTDAGWDSDWTAAELDGMEVRITPTQSGMPGTNAVDIDCADIIVTYTAFIAFEPTALSETEPPALNSFLGPLEI